MSRELQVIPPREVARGFDPMALVNAGRADMAERVGSGELAATTAATYARGMLAFLAWHEQHAPAPRVGPSSVRAWMKADLEQGRKPAGVNVRLSAVKAFFRWATAEGLLAYDPTANVRRASVRGRARRHKRDPLSDAEVLRILAQPDPTTDKGLRDRALLSLMAYTGARTIETQRARLQGLRTSGDPMTLDV